MLQKKYWNRVAGLAVLSLCVLTAAEPALKSVNSDWNTYGGIKGQHYSPLDQINRSNAKDLTKVWTFDTGELGTIQTTPLIVGRRLVLASPTGRIIAIDAATSQKLWVFDPGFKDSQPIRGFSYWDDSGSGRIMVGILNFLYQLDLATGQPVTTFGNNGRIDLREGLDRDPKTATVAMTSPGAVYKDVIIVGFRAPETHPAPPGDIRAFDLHTGKLRWAFHTIPKPGEFGYDTWPTDSRQTSGAANDWPGLTTDAQNGLVFAATGSAVSDFYGGDRLGNDLFANCLIALDAETGKRLWHFQGVHHDIWDRDFSAPPVLLTVKRNGKNIDAVAQTTKQGFVFLFNRKTGEPLFPIDEVKVPPSTVPGESASPTQPIPRLPVPYVPQTVTEQTLTDRTPQAHAWALEQYRGVISGTSQFVPLSLHKQTIAMPGFDGGAEWGGAAVDPQTAVLYVNSNQIANTGGLIKTQKTSDPGKATYMTQCSVCHGQDRKGSPPEFPSLVGVTDRLTVTEITQTIHGGRGRMPSFSNLTGPVLDELLAYLRNGEASPTANTSAQKELQTAGVVTEPYQFTGYKRFVDPEGYPATAPPWGTLSAIDLNSGQYLWHIPFGEYPELTAQGMKPTGTENYGGPVVTKGGILFIGATIFDRRFHVYDSQSGKLLWETELPFGGLATPATYMIDGRQYVVIAAGGGKDPKREKGGVYVCFALPAQP